MPPHHAHVQVNWSTIWDAEYRMPYGEGERAYRGGLAMEQFIEEYNKLLLDTYECMKLAASDEYFWAAFDELYPGGWKEICGAILWSMLQDLVFVVWSAGVGAYIGGAASATIPPLQPYSIAFGAALGASIAAWVLWAHGIVMAVKGAFELSPQVGRLISEGITLVSWGNKDGAAKCFARAFAMIFGAIVPMIVLTLFLKGGVAFARLIATVRTMAVERAALSAARRETVDGLLSGLENIQAVEVTTPPQANAIGMEFEELGGLKVMTRGIFKVGRCCNPDRVTAIRRAMAAAGKFGETIWDLISQKPGYFKDLKSIKTGPFAGQYWASKEWMETYLGEMYRKVQTRHSSVLEEVTDKLVSEEYEFRLEATDKAPVATGNYLDGTSPVKDGPWLDGTILTTGKNGGVEGYFIKSRDGKTVIPDFDRLLYHEINDAGGLGRSGEIRGQRWLPNDDPLEVTWWNQRMSRAILELRNANLPAFQKASRVVDRVKSAANRFGQRKPNTVLAWTEEGALPRKLQQGDRSVFLPPAGPISNEAPYWTGFAHGNSAKFVMDFTKKLKELAVTEYDNATSNIRPGWPGLNKITHRFEIENELLWIAVDGRVFVTDWHGLAAFYEARRSIVGQFPWIDHVIKGETKLAEMPR